LYLEKGARFLAVGLVVGAQSQPNQPGNTMADEKEVKAEDVPKEDLKESTPGTMDMKVTTKKSTGFYIKAAKSFFTGIEDKDGNKKEPICVLNISGLGDSINSVVAAAAAIESEGLGTIKKIETSYPEMKSGATSRGCPRIAVTLYHK